MYMIKILHEVDTPNLEISQRRMYVYMCAPKLVSVCVYVYMCVCVCAWVRV